MRLAYIDGQLHQVEKLPSPMPIGSLVKHSHFGSWHLKEKKPKAGVRWKPVHTRHLPKPLKLQALLLGIQP